MNFQQKLWKGTAVLFRSLFPLILYIVVPGLLAAFGSLLRHFPGSMDSFLLESGNFYQILGTLLCFFFFRKRAQKRGTTVEKETTIVYEGFDRKLALSYLWLGFFSALAVSAVLTLLPLPEVIRQSYQESSAAVFQRTDLVLAVINLLVLAPLVEEMIFRGYMLSELLRFFEEREAVYITSAVFALCHVDLLWMIYAFIMGLILCRTAIKKDNILYGIVLHGGFNLFSAVNLVFSGSAFLTDRVLVFLYGITGVLSVLLIRRELLSREEWYL